jgi:hypothetical protein
VFFEKKGLSWRPTCWCPTCSCPVHVRAGHVCARYMFAPNMFAPMLVPACARSCSLWCPTQLRGEPPQIAHRHVGCQQCEKLLQYSKFGTIISLSIVPRLVHIRRNGEGRPPARLVCPPKGLRKPGMTTLPVLDHTLVHKELSVVNVAFR